MGVQAQMPDDKVIGK